MKKLFFFIIISSVLIASCKSRTNRSVSSSRLPEPDLIERLKSQKATIDTLFNHSKDKIVLFARMADKDELQKITYENFPEDVETSFSILKDSLGKIITASEIPVSQSGDWYIVLTHYFDQNGKTFAFERQTNFFNSICTEGVAYETKTEYYNDKFEIIDSLYKFIDEKNQPLQKDSCGHPYNFEYKVLADANKYLQAKSIKNIQ